MPRSNQRRYYFLGHNNLVNVYSKQIFLYHTAITIPVMFIPFCKGMAGMESRNGATKALRGITTDTLMLRQDFRLLSHRYIISYMVPVVRTMINHPACRSAEHESEAGTTRPWSLSPLESITQESIRSLVQA